MRAINKNPKLACYGRLQPQPICICRIRTPVFARSDVQQQLDASGTGTRRRGTHCTKHIVQHARSVGAGPFLGRRRCLCLGLVQRCPELCAEGRNQMSGGQRVVARPCHFGTRLAYAERTKQTGRGRHGGCHLLRLVFCGFHLFVYKFGRDEILLLGCADVVVLQPFQKRFVGFDKFELFIDGAYILRLTCCSTKDTKSPVRSGRLIESWRRIPSRRRRPANQAKGGEGWVLEDQRGCRETGCPVPGIEGVRAWVSR